MGNVLWRNIYLLFVICTAAILGGCNGDELTIHNPRANTFIVPDNDEPVAVLISFPDTWEPDSNVMTTFLLNEDGVTVSGQGYLPMSAPVIIEPGSIAGQQQMFNIPEVTHAGWYTIRAVAIRRLDDGTTESIRGDSERFWISRIGILDGSAGLMVILGPSTPAPYRPGGRIQIVAAEWGGSTGGDFDCSGSSDYPSAILFKGGSHGISHQHWQLERESGEIYIIPDDVPSGTDYFIWADNGPLCNGTSDDNIEIVAP